MKPEASNSHPSEEINPQNVYKDAWNTGYWDGVTLKNKDNPFKFQGNLWKEYEDGYEEGWLDS